MSARPVTYYEVVCDHADCGFKTADMSDEYSAWVDEDQALDSWRDSDGYVSDDGGLTLCPDHYPEFCVDCDLDDGEVIATGRTADDQPACDKHKVPTETHTSKETT